MNFNLIPWDTEAYLIAADYAEENGCLLPKAIRDKILPLHVENYDIFDFGYGNGEGEGSGYYFNLDRYGEGDADGSGDGSGDGYGDGFGDNW